MGTLTSVSTLQAHPLPMSSPVSSDSYMAISALKTDAEITAAIT